MKVNYSDNKTLVNHLKNGDEDAYAYLMDSYYNKLCVYAKSLCRDVYLAEDIVQNIFMIVWEKRDRLKHSYSIKSYLYQSVYNEFINQYRKKNSLLSLEKEYIHTLKNLLEEEEEEDPNDLSRLITLVKEEIQNLPPKCKKVFILGKQDGLTYAEISEHLGVSFRTVENRMSKAFSLIREKVGDKLNTILFLLFGNKSRYSSQ